MRIYKLRVSLINQRIYLDKDVYVLYPTEIYTLGHYLVPRIKKVLEIDGDHSLDYVLGQIASGNMPVICFEREGSIEFFVVGVVNAYSLKRVFTIFLAEGKGLVEGVKGIIAHIETLAKQMNCSEVEIIGRKGHARLLPDYKQTDIVLRKKL